MERFICINNTRDDQTMELPPGFRFHPTDEELITQYLSPKARNSSFTTGVIGEADLNKVEPWDLPWKAKTGEKEWYFFCIRDRKYPTGSRTNRATDAGYWKATGKDKEIFRAKTLIGMKKTLVFYRGRAPKGEKTNWVMHEYRLEGNRSMHNLPKTAKNEWVISRIFKKSGGMKVHISGLVRGGDYGVHLPSLTDISTDKYQARTTLAAEGSHVTCFSNQIEENSIDEFSSCSKNIDHFTPFTFSNPNSDLSPLIQNVLSTENSPRPNSGSLQDESMLQLMRATNGPFAKQIGTSIADISSDITDDEVGFGPYEDDQEFPVPPLDFDCLWNY